MCAPARRAQSVRVVRDGAVDRGAVVYAAKGRSVGRRQIGHRLSSRAAAPFLLERRRQPSRVRFEGSVQYIAERKLYLFFLKLDNDNERFLEFRKVKQGHGNLSHAPDSYSSLIELLRPTPLIQPASPAGMGGLSKLVRRSPPCHPPWLRAAAPKLLGGDCPRLLGGLMLKDFKSWVIVRRCRSWTSRAWHEVPIARGPDRPEVGRSPVVTASATNLCHGSG